MTARPILTPLPAVFVLRSEAARDAGWPGFPA